MTSKSPYVTVSKPARASRSCSQMCASWTSTCDEVPQDGTTVGEIVARGNNVMDGYYKQPEETAQVMRGGWFHTGDLAVMHPDGYIEVVDRAKDVIISGGENISSVEVEAMLYEHPAVLEAAVVGIPDSTWGEVPKALVVLKPGQQTSAQELITFCREHMAHFKAPEIGGIFHRTPENRHWQSAKVCLAGTVPGRAE